MKRICSFLFTFAMCFGMCTSTFALENRTVRTVTDVGDITNTPEVQAILNAEENDTGFIDTGIATEVVVDERGVVKQWMYYKATDAGSERGAWSTTPFAIQPGQDGVTWTAAFTGGYSGTVSASITVNTSKAVQADLGFSITKETTFSTSLSKETKTGVTYRAYYAPQFALYRVIEAQYWWDDAQMDWVTDGSVTRDVGIAKKPILPALRIDP